MNWTAFFQWYWGSFLGVVLGLFLVPETTVLAIGHPEWTLSDWVWHHEGFLPGTPIIHWNAFHYLIGMLVIALALWLITIAVWMVGHLVFGVWA